MNRTQCPHCEEEIQLSDLLKRGRVQTLASGQLIHVECLARMVIGSIGHQLGRCPCFGGTEEDPPGLTAREAAKAALRHFFEHQASTN